MDYYDVLNVDENSTKKSIKISYRRLVITHHPDKGGDADIFSRINHAYNILSDDTCRRIYDEHGHESANDY